MSPGSSGPDIAPDLVIADRVWDWVGDRLYAFHPFHQGPAFKVQFAQRVPELAIAVLSHRRSGLPRHPALDRAIEMLLAVQAERALMDRVVRSPQEFALYLDVYALLRQLGHEDADYQYVLRCAIEAGLLQQAERMPHRLMDIALSLYWADLPNPLPPMQELLKRSLLWGLPDPAHLDQSAMYALTHIVFFCHAFGIEEAPPARLAASPPMRRLFSGLLWRACQEAHWDLLAELLLCWDCIGLEQTPIYSETYGRLLAQQDAAGGFPGPAVALAEGTLPTESEDAHRYVSHYYHTTLIVALLLAQRNRVKTRSLPTEDPTTITLPERPIESVALERNARRALTDAADWASRLAQSTVSSERPSQLAAAILALWLTTDNSGPPRRGLESLIVRFSSALQGSFAQPPPVATAAALIHALGLADATIDAYLEVLRHALDLAPIDDMDLLETRVVLYGLGIGNDPFRPSTESIVSAATEALASGEPAAIGRFARGLAAHSRDRGDAPNDAVPVWLTELAEAMGGFCLRQGDLEGAARIWRAAMLAAPRDGDLRQRVLTLLMLHQRPSGEFGFFGPEERMLAARDIATTSEDPWIWANLQVCWALHDAVAVSWGTERRLVRTPHTATETLSPGPAAP